MKMIRSRFFPVVFCLLLLSGCAETQLVTHWAKTLWPGEQETKSGTYKVGKPYNVDGVVYHPQENFRLVETGIASWYGPGFHAQYTANGEKYDQNELTAAHRTLQLPSIVRVTNLENGKSVIVRVNDRGPFKHGRIMDVSKRAAELLGFIGQGTARVRIEVMENESRIIAEAARRGDDTTRVASAAGTKEAEMASAAPLPEIEESAESLPESLKTPTITVEELKAPGVYAPPPARPQPSSRMAEGSVRQGRFLPAPVVSTAPVSPTGIFVQAGSFAVRENAERLKDNLSRISRTVIEPVTVNGRDMYRVKLGPIATVEEADALLEKVIRAGQGAARVVKPK